MPDEHLSLNNLTKPCSRTHLDLLVATDVFTAEVWSWGGLAPGQSLLHDRAGQYCPAFPQRIDAAGITRVPLPPRSPHVNAYAERWVKSVKEECLARWILFGEAALCRALQEYMAHDHQERNHQGKGNMLLFPAVSQDTERAGPIRCRERLGGLLKYYEREVA